MTLRERFSSFYELTEEEKKTLWEEGVFYLDSSVLLSLYRYPETAREDMFKMLEAIKDRVWVPHHVGIEYHRNRLKVIQEQKDQFEQVESDVEDAIAGLRRKFKELHERHPLIEPNLLFDDLEQAKADFCEHLSVLKDKQPSFRDEDVIGRRINDLIGENLTDDPVYSQEDVDKLIEEALRRGEAKVPPGYKDYKEKKGQPQWDFNGLDYHPIQGDLTIWDQILKHAKKIGANSVVFLTDDQKEDWWEEFHGETIGPRRRLREEIFRDGKVELFHMYKPKGFLVEGAKRLNVKVEDASPQQVEDAARAFMEGYRHAKRLFELTEASPNIERVIGVAQPMPLPDALYEPTLRYIGDAFQRSHVQSEGGGTFVMYPAEQPDEKSLVFAFLLPNRAISRDVLVKFIRAVSDVHGAHYYALHVLFVVEGHGAVDKTTTKSLMDLIFQQQQETGVYVQFLEAVRDGLKTFLVSMF